ncbi:MAG: Hsp20/alpha crystallin family protein [Thermodesulfobacteriota bacterium]|nr:Hsp20/alpha crystallin family protein [Thermodesulfobacteriota bacterium]
MNTPGKTNSKVGGNDIEVVQWRPYGIEFSNLRKEMDDLWRRFIGETAPARSVSGEWSPSVDLSETKDSLVVKVELPGLEAKDFDVSISGNILTIKGKREKEEQEKNDHYHNVERYYGAFQRSFQLPTAIKDEKIEATFDKGVLKITLPKVDEAKKRDIEIKVK